MARQSGEVKSPPPEWLYFGREGGFVYHLDERSSPRKIGGKPVALYRYDRAATREKLTLLGIPLGLVQQAVESDEEARLQVAYEEGMRDRPEIAGTEVDVRIELWEDEWRVFCAGELAHTVPRGEIDPEDVDAIRELAQQIGQEYVEASKEPAP